LFRYRKKKKCWCCCLDDSDIERFLKVEGGSSADIMGEVEGLAVAEDTGPRESERPARVEAPAVKW
jgi:hypothetical protein